MKWAQMMNKLQAWAQIVAIRHSIHICKATDKNVTYIIHSHKALFQWSMDQENSLSSAYFIFLVSYCVKQMF